MKSLSAFDQPQKLLDRAMAACKEAQAAFVAFINPDNYSAVIDREGISGYFVKKISITGQIPDIIESRITDAINNTKNSFDQSLFAACSAIGKPRGFLHYPWVDREELLERKLQGGKAPKNAIPNELWDAIRLQQPYPRDDLNQRGDTIVRAMARLANNKHTIGTRIAGHVASFSYGTIRPGAGLNDFEILWPTWDTVKNEIIIARWRGAPPQFEDKTTIAFKVAFDLTPPHPLLDQCAMNATLAFIQAAQRALEAFKSRAIEMGAT